MNEDEKNALVAELTHAVPGLVSAHLADASTRQKIADAVEAIVTGKRSPDDPYRTTIHFLAGLLTFCLGVIAAVFSVLSDSNAEPYRLSYRMLGGVLASIAFVAWLCTVAAAFVQTEKYRHRSGRTPYRAPPVFLRAALMLALTLLGGVPVAYCVRYGYAILADLDEPIGLLDSLIGVLTLAF